METNLMRATVLACIALLVGMAEAPAQTAPQPQQSCFLITEMRGWKALDNKTIFIRVGLNQIYRLDLSAACPMLTMPDAHLITKTRGPDTVCSAIDWDLSVSEPPPAAMPEPCIVKQMTQLTPEQAAAIPPKYRP
jgi:Family of unknown function (DUF6491)